MKRNVLEQKLVYWTWLNVTDRGRIVIKLTSQTNKTLLDRETSEFTMTATKH